MISLQLIFYNKEKNYGLVYHEKYKNYPGLLPFKIDLPRNEPVKISSVLFFVIRSITIEYLLLAQFFK